MWCSCNWKTLVIVFKWPIEGQGLKRGIREETVGKKTTGPKAVSLRPNGGWIPNLIADLTSPRNVVLTRQAGIFSTSIPGSATWALSILQRKKR